MAAHAEYTTEHQLVMTFALDGINWFYLIHVSQNNKRFLFSFFFFLLERGGEYLVVIEKVVSHNITTFFRTPFPFYKA